MFPIRLGVKQGDNLCPNLFTFFIKNLPEYFVSMSDDCVQLGDKLLHCLMYADDIYYQNPQMVHNKNSTVLNIFAMTGVLM